MNGKGFFVALSPFAASARRVFLPLLFLALTAAAASRIHLQLQFQPGETLFYQVETHTSSTGKTTTPIINPEGGTNFSDNVDLLVRLDILPPDAGRGDPSAASPPGTDQEPVRIRVTYQRAHADSQTDAPAFDAPSVSQQYHHIEGHSLELTLKPDGVFADVKDPDNIFSNVSAASPALSWMQILVSVSDYPRRGIAIGDKWTTEKPLDSAPLAGLVLHSESNYLRNERCKTPQIKIENQSKAGAESAAQQCAVILTQFEIVRRGSAHVDRTPPDFLHHGLRTAGTLTGSGETLDSISIGTGLLVSSTQTSTQRADFDIIDAANGEKIHRAGEVQVQTVITRVDASPVAQP
jgi:hypothetical protein